MPENTAGTHPASLQPTPPIFPPSGLLSIPLHPGLCWDSCRDAGPALGPAELDKDHWSHLSSPPPNPFPLAVASARAGLGFLALGCGHQLPLLPQCFHAAVPHLGTSLLQEQGLGINTSFQNALSSQLQIQNGKCCSKFRAAIPALALSLIQCSQDLSLR